MRISSGRWIAWAVVIGMVAGSVGCQSTRNMFSWSKKKPTTSNLAANRPPEYLTPPSVGMTPYGGTTQPAGATMTAANQPAGHDHSQHAHGQAGSNPYATAAYATGQTKPAASGYYTGQYPTAGASSSVAAGSTPSSGTQQGFYSPRYPVGPSARTANAATASPGYGTSGSVGYPSATPSYPAASTGFNPAAATAAPVTNRGGYAPATPAGYGGSSYPSTPTGSSTAPSGYPSSSGYGTGSTYPASSSFTPGSTGRSSSFPATSSGSAYPQP